MSRRKGALYGITYTRAALGGLKSIEPKKHRQQVKDKIDKLSKEPHPRGATRLKDVEHNGEPVYRIRSGDYRVLYCVTDGNPTGIIVLDIGHRKQIYGRGK